MYNYNGYNTNLGPQRHNIRGPRRRNNEIDVHEMSKQQLAKQDKDHGDGYKFVTKGNYPISNQKNPSLIPGVYTSVPTPTSSANIQPGAAEIGISDTYLYFNSFENVSNSDLENGVISFPIPSINNNKPVQNIIELECTRFFMPDITEGATDPDFWFFKRAYIYIEQLSATQSALAFNQNKYHFEFEVVPSGISVEMVPIRERSKYTFTKPVRDLTEITFRILRPPFFERVPIPQSLFGMTPVSGTTPGRVTTSEPHGLPVTAGPYPTGYVAVTIKEWSSNGPASVNSAMVRSGGHMVNVIDANTIEFDSTAGVDFALVTSGSGVLGINFRRIAFEMRFRSIVSSITNYIAP